MRLSLHLCNKTLLLGLVALGAGCAAATAPPATERPKKRIAPPVVRVLAVQRWTTMSGRSNRYEIRRSLAHRFLERGEAALREGRGTLAAEIAEHTLALQRKWGVADPVLTERAEALRRRSRRVLGVRLHELAPAKR